MQACPSKSAAAALMSTSMRRTEEPPRMSSEMDACLRKADEAKQRAAQATEPSIKSAYEKVAEHWMLLARLESLVAAEKNSEDA
jgi:hypothetical protein